jgi:hypothetical protein
MQRQRRKQKRQESIESENEETNQQLRGNSIISALRNYVLYQQRPAWRTLPHTGGT